MKTRPASVSPHKLYAQPLPIHNRPFTPFEFSTYSFRARHYSSSSMKSARFTAGFLQHVHINKEYNQHSSLARISVLGKKVQATARIHLANSPLLCIKNIAKLQPKLASKRNVLTHVKTDFKHELDPDYLGNIITMYKDSKYFK